MFLCNSYIDNRKGKSEDKLYIQEDQEICFFTNGKNSKIIFKEYVIIL